MGEDIGLSAALLALQTDFCRIWRRRVRDTPISEAAIIGASVGAAVRYETS